MGSLPIGNVPAFERSPEVVAVSGVLREVYESAWLRIMGKIAGGFEEGEYTRGHIADGVATDDNKGTVIFSNYSSPEDNTSARTIAIIRNPQGKIVEVNDSVFVEGTNINERSSFPPRKDDTRRLPLARTAFTLLKSKQSWKRGNGLGWHNWGSN